jgi:hypothetical protein
VSRAGRVAIGVVAASLVLGAGLLWSAMSEQPFYDYLAERRAAGRPTRAAEAAGGMPPAVENGADELEVAWRELFPAVDGPPPGWWMLGRWDWDYEPPEHGEWPDGATPEQVAQLGEFVAHVRPWSTRRDAALAKPRIRFDPRRSPPGSDWTQALRGIQRVITHQAEGEDEAGRRLDACRALLRLSVGLEPTSFGERLTGLAISASGVMRLRHEIETGCADAVAARRLCDEWLRDLAGDTSSDLLRAWAVAMVEGYDDMLAGRITTPDGRPLRYSWSDSVRSLARRTKARWAGESMPIDFLPGMATDVVAIAKSLDGLADADVATLSSIDGVRRLDPSEPLRAYEVDAAVQRVVERLRVGRAQRRLARVALGIGERRAVRGEFPTSLDDLRDAFDGDVPLDPFTDAAFVYERTATRRPRRLRRSDARRHAVAERSDAPRPRAGVEPSPMTRRRAGVVVAFAASVAAALAWRALHEPSERAYFDYVAELRADGEPTTFEELAGPMPPDADNAAPEIDAAWSAAEPVIGPPAAWPAGVLSEGGVCRPPSTSALDEAQMRRLVDFADCLDAFADRVGAAVDRSRCRWPVVLDEKGLASTPHCARVESVIRLLDARARFARDPAARLVACRALARLGDVMEADAWEEHRLAEATVVGCTLALREGIGSRLWSAADVRRRLDGVLVGDSLARLQRPLRWGSVYVATAYGALLDGRLAPDHQRIGLLRTAWEQAVRGGRRVVGRRVSRPLETGTAGDVVGLCRAYRAAADAPSTACSRWDEEFHALKKSFGVDWIADDACDLGWAAIAREARTRLMRIGLAVAAFREDHGELPASLDDLRDAFAEGIPLDPYSDAPFLWRRTESSLRIWANYQRPPAAPPTFEEAADYVLGWEFPR